MWIKIAHFRHKGRQEAAGRAAEIPVIIFAPLIGKTRLPEADESAGLESDEKNYNSRDDADGNSKPSCLKNFIDRVRNLETFPIIHSFIALFFFLKISNGVEIYID
jgi:hypothetical protein